MAWSRLDYMIWELFSNLNDSMIYGVWLQIWACAHLWVLQFFSSFGLYLLPQGQTDFQEVMGHLILSRSWKEALC